MEPPITYSISAYCAHLKLSSAKQAAKHISLFLRYALGDTFAREDADAVSLSYISSVLAGERLAPPVLRSYVEYLNAEKYAPYTISARITTLIKWMKWNGVSFTQQEEGIIRSLIPRVIPISEDEDITAEQIRSILSHADVLVRALVLLACSSGARISEILSLTPNDFQSSQPHSFRLDRERMKGGRAHTYYFSQEAYDALQEWEKQRDSYALSAQAKTELCLKKKAKQTNGRIFPVEYETVRKKLGRAVKNAELERIDTVGHTVRTSIHFHSFRKFCDSDMKKHIPINVANALIGHYEAGDTAYRRYDKTTLQKAYAECEPYLTIMAPADYAELHTVTQERITETNATVSALAHKIVTLEEEHAAILRFMRVMAEIYDREKA